MAAASIEEPYRYSPQTAYVSAGGDPTERQTRQEISQIVAELGDLVRQALPAEVFWPEFLRRLHCAMAADGAVAWILREGQPPQTAGRVGDITDLSIERLDTASRQAHQRLLTEVGQSGQPLLVPANSVVAGSGNPLSDLDVLVPIEIGDGRHAVIEVFLPDVGGPATQRGYLRFAAQMSDLAGEYLRGAALRQLNQAAERWRDVARWSTWLHTSHSNEEVARRTVDAAPHFTDVERVSWVTRTRGGWKLLATTGLDHVEPRGEVARWFADQAMRLAGATNGQRTGACEPTGDNPTGLELVGYAFIHWPRPHESELQSIDTLRKQSPSFELTDAIESTAPRRSVDTEDARGDDTPGSRALPGGDDPAPLALLLFQSTRRVVWADDRSAVAQAMASQAAGALRATSLSQSIPVLGPWLLRRGYRASSWRSLTLATVVAACLVLLLSTPIPFRVIAPATLEPDRVVQVQAPRDGVLMRLHVKHDETVEAGAIIAQIYDADLDRQEEDLLGRQAVLDQRGIELQRMLLRGETPQRRAELDAEGSEIEAELQSLRQQLGWVQQQREQLTVRAPVGGQVDAWETRGFIEGKQVRRGQRLVQIIEPDVHWHLRAEIPQNRLDHVLASKQQRPSLPVTVLLRSLPDQPLDGALTALGPTTVTNAQGQAIGWSDIQIDAEHLPLKQPGSAATVAIDCGHRPIGYVLFQDLLKAVIRYWRLWS